MQLFLQFSKTSILRYFGSSYVLSRFHHARIFVFSLKFLLYFLICLLSALLSSKLKQWLRSFSYSYLYYLWKGINSIKPAALLRTSSKAAWSRFSKCSAVLRLSLLCRSSIPFQEIPSGDMQALRWSMHAVSPVDKLKSGKTWVLQPHWERWRHSWNAGAVADAADLAVREPIFGIFRFWIERMGHWRVLPGLVFGMREGW